MVPMGSLGLNMEGVQYEPRENCGDCMILQRGMYLYIWSDALRPVLGYRFTLCQKPDKHRRILRTSSSYQPCGEGIITDPFYR